MEKKTGLDLLREPFDERLINLLPKGTKAQNECPANEKIHCKECGGFHHPKVIHLKFVGHAALTDRLLDADPLWSWEPFALKDGLPAFDTTGGLWIKLTVAGHTRIGYGHAAASSFKEIGSREKEVIGDALRNAAMRFGAALDLWHKGDLHIEDEDATVNKGGVQSESPPPPPQMPSNAPNPDGASESMTADLTANRKRLEILIQEEKIDRDRFKEWAVKMAMIPVPAEGEKPSMNNMSDSRVKQTITKWESAIAMFKAWDKEERLT